MHIECQMKFQQKPEILFSVLSHVDFTVYFFIFPVGDQFHMLAPNGCPAKNLERLGLENSR